MDIQTLIVAALAVVSAAWLIRKFARGAKGAGGCGCGCAGSCPSGRGAGRPAGKARRD